ncbi:MAG: cation-transporting ATPase pacS [Myxococcales bacterium]|nr:cation-transporting ATPase pacS [Myxococcales bacterium]
MDDLRLVRERDLDGRDARNRTEGLVDVAHAAIAGHPGDAQGGGHTSNVASVTEQTIDLPVLGMTCAACVRRVEQAVAGVPGVASAAVNLPLSRARIVLDLEIATTQQLATAIREAGYEVPQDLLDVTATGGSRLLAIERAEHEEARGLRRDATIAIAVTIPLFAIAMTHGLVDPMASVIVQLVLGSIVFLGPGFRYVRRGFAAVRHGSPDMNTLIALGAGAAWLSSTVASLRWLAGPRDHMPEIYFEAGAAIIAFVMIGKLLEARARARLSEAVRGLLSLAPATARKLTDQREVEVDAGLLAPGDVITVRPGERLAADGTIVEGSSALDESMLTGESMPIDKAEGSPVYAGTLNHNGALSVRVARAGADTTLARIARAVEDAQGQKASIARLADRVSAVFVPAVLVIAGGTFGTWLLAGTDSSTALERMVAVLVIACPCALGLATPAAVAVGTARGAQLGILFKGGEVLEVASRITIACLDKTGTLTTGKPTFVSITPDAPEVLRLAASAEHASEHPIARAIVDGARARDLVLERATNVTIAPGGGVSAKVGNHTVLVGTRDYLAGDGVNFDNPPDAPSHVSDATTAGRLPAHTLSFVAIDGRLAGMIAVADPPAAAARETIAKLRALGIEPVMITGDREETARQIASAVGITRIHAGARPTEKAAIVLAERARGRVGMIGDGVNDAPALAAADLGIALGSGTDIAAAAADVTLLHGGISALPTVFELARATLRTIRRNLIAAFAYNVVCIPIAAAGLLSPVLASAAMSLSSVTVLLSSLRLKKWRSLERGPRARE